MNKCNRNQASTLFRTRIRMIRLKGNYKNGSTNLICRACKTDTETQQHILEECLAIHLGRIGPTIDPFSNDLDKLKKIAKEIEEIVRNLEAPSGS